jgi:hypothetical protein
MRRPIGVVLAVLTLAGAPARAQLMTSPVQDLVNKTSILNDVLSNKRAPDAGQKRQAARKRPTPRRAAPTANAPTEAEPAPSATEATATAPVSVESTKFRQSAPLLPDMLAAATSEDPTKRAEARQLFGGLLELYMQTARKDGFPADDLAYAFEYFVVNNYATYHDIHDLDYTNDPRLRREPDAVRRVTILTEKSARRVTLPQERAVYDQFRTLLASNAQIRQLSDRDKQQLTELLAIMMGVTYASYVRGIQTGDEAMIEQARQTARAGLERLTGVPVDRLTIGDAGLGQ